MKEKTIENSIVEFLKIKWAVVEWMQSWAVMILKWNYKNRMNLQSDGCPDVMCFYKSEYIWIEVKKNEKEVEKWIKQEKRFLRWEKIPKSYKREEDQIKYKYKILDNWGTFILTCKLSEVIDYINNLDKKYKKDLQ